MSKINSIVASAANTETNIGIVSNMSAHMMAVYREINRRYENNGIDLPKIDKPKFDKSKFKFDNDGDFDGACIVDMPARNSRFVPFITKDAFSYVSNELTRMYKASYQNNTEISIQDDDIEDFVLEDEFGWE